MVRHTGSPDRWGVPGGAVEIGESPAQAAVREIGEEIGVQIGRLRLLDVLGGTDYEVTYSNGDQVAYVTAVYEAVIVDGTPAPDQEEICELDWFTPARLRSVGLNRFTRALLGATGHLAS
ncbi:NUDIX domain-containing protein [Micromonospora sp. NPDC049751]|uniref:NUDIX domain-containing protein n=1 Tax=unclassified Micromonospora TaxID=2617518 RepID=UPI00340F39F9